jgi:hypothetical protein
VQTSDLTRCHLKIIWKNSLFKNPILINSYHKYIAKLSPHRAQKLTQLLIIASETVIEWSQAILERVLGSQPAAAKRPANELRTTKSGKNQ